MPRSVSREHIDREALTVDQNRAQRGRGHAPDATRRGRGGTRSGARGGGARGSGTAAAAGSRQHEYSGGSEQADGKRGTRHGDLPGGLPGSELPVDYLGHVCRAVAVHNGLINGARRVTRSHGGTGDLLLWASSVSPPSGDRRQHGARTRSLTRGKASGEDLRATAREK